MKPSLALQKLLKKHLPRDPDRERREEQQSEDGSRDADERREQQQGDDRQDVSPHHVRPHQSADTMTQNSPKKKAIPMIKSPSLTFPSDFCKGVLGKISNLTAR